MTPRSTLGLERDDHLTAWLIVAQLLWFPLASSTVINGWIIAHREEGFFEWSALFVVMMALLGVVFGISSLWLSLSVTSGPRRKLSKPVLKYFATTLLAMTLAWCVHVFGGVCSLYDTPPVAVLLAFFVPTWLLFLMNLPTRAKIRRWLDADDRRETIEPS